MNGPEGQMQRLRLWLAAYGGNQPDERRRRMGAAMVRYLTGVAFRRRAGGSDGPVEPVDPIRGVDRID